MTKQKPWVKQEDIEKMTAALENFRGAEWWFQTENSEISSNALSPLVMQNMTLQFEAGTLELNVNKFKNALNSAILYNLEARMLQRRVTELEEQLAKLTAV